MVAIKIEENPSPAKHWFGTVRPMPVLSMTMPVLSMTPPTPMPVGSTLRPVSDNIPVPVSSNLDVNTYVLGTQPPLPPSITVKVETPITVEVVTPATPPPPPIRITDYNPPVPIRVHDGDGPARRTRSRIKFLKKCFSQRITGRQSYGLGLDLVKCPGETRMIPREERKNLRRSARLRQLSRHKITY